MKNWLLRLLFGTASVVLIVAFTAWWLVRSSLPTLDGELSVQGIEREASIERDEQVACK